MEIWQALIATGVLDPLGSEKDYSDMRRLFIHQNTVVSQLSLGFLNDLAGAYCGGSAGPPGGDAGARQLEGKQSRKVLRVLAAFNHAENYQGSSRVTTKTGGSGQELLEVLRVGSGCFQFSRVGSAHPYYTRSNPPKRPASFFFARPVDFRPAVVIHPQ